MEKIRPLKSRLSKQDEFEEEEPVDLDTGLAVGVGVGLTLGVGVDVVVLDVDEMTATEVPVDEVCGTDANGGKRPATTVSGSGSGSGSGSNSSSPSDSPECPAGNEMEMCPALQQQQQHEQQHEQPAADKGNRHSEAAVAKGEKTESNRGTGRQRLCPKVKLLRRSHAVRDDTSPPPDYETVSSNTLSVTSATSLTTQTKSSSNKHYRLTTQGSSQGSMEGSSPALSRDSSIEQYTDSTGIDLQQFIIDTLHKNQKDRIMLLKIEQELTNLYKDNKRQHHKFPQMSSYQRMLVHRVAAFFGMDHNVDQAGTSVVVSKTKNTRIPEAKFREFIRDELVPEEPKKSILKRDSSSFEDGKDLKSPERQLSGEGRRSKSFEEREEEYEKARKRIFNQDSQSSQEGAADSPLRSHESTHNSSRLSSQEDLRWVGEPRPWSSTDSDSSNRQATRPVITKTSASTESEPSSGSSGGVRLPLSLPPHPAPPPPPTSLPPPPPPPPIPPSSLPPLPLQPLNMPQLHSKKLEKSESAEATMMGYRENTLHPNHHWQGMAKASSFGGISVLARSDSITNTKSVGLRFTKAESFSSSNGGGVYAPSEYRMSPASGVSMMGVVGKGQAPLHAHEAVGNVPTSTAVSVASSGTSPIHMDNPASPHATNFYGSFPGQFSSQPGGWNAVGQSLDATQSFLSQGRPVVWAVSNMESVPPGSVLINPQTGLPYLNSDGSVYRYNPGNMAMTSHASPATQAVLQHQPPLLLATQQMPQPQPPQPTQSSVVLCSPSIHPTHFHPTEQRHYTSESQSVNDLTSQFSGLVFATQPSAESVVNADGSVAQQGVLLSSVRAQPTLQSHQAPGPTSQMPLYLVSPSQAPTSQSLRFIYPFSYPTQASSHMIDTQCSSQAPVMGQPSQQAVHPHPQTPTQQQNFHFPTGTHYIHSYPVMGYSHQLGSNVPNEHSIMPPYVSLASPVAPGASVPGYTYTVPMNTASNNTAVNASHAAYLNVCGHLPSGAAPVTPVPVYQQAQNNNFRPQTPPSQNTVQGNHGLCGYPHTGQQLSSLGRSYSLTAAPPPSTATVPTSAPPCLGYPVYPQQMNPSQQQQPTVPAMPQQPSHHPHHHAPPAQTPSQYSSVLTSLPMFRPTVQMMAVRSNTPPPSQGLISGPYSGSAPYLAKGYSFPLDQRLGKMSDVYMLDPSMAGSLWNLADVKAPPMGPGAVPNGIPGLRPNAAPMYSRGVPLLKGDLRFIGQPLQHHQMGTQMRTGPMIVPQQRPVTRFSISHQQSFSSGRPPKVRKQRSKASSLADSVNLSQVSVDLNGGPHVLEVQGFPEGMRKSDLERYLEEVVHHGGKLQFVCNNNSSIEPLDLVITPERVKVRAVFESEPAAHSALMNIKTPKFQLRIPAANPHTPGVD